MADPTVRLAAVAVALRRIFDIVVTLEYPGYLAIAEAQVNDDVDTSTAAWAVGPGEEAGSWTGQLERADGTRVDDMTFCVYPEQDTPESIAAAVYTHGIGDHYIGGGCADCPVRKAVR